MILILHFRRFLILFFLVSIFNSVAIEAKEIACEKVEGQTCEMIMATAIETPDVKISNRDSSINRLVIRNSPKIFYLPIGVAENFPDLISYFAAAIPIKEISKQNFLGLSKVNSLWMYGTKVEKIPSDTFIDLVALETLYISK